MKIEKLNENQVKFILSRDDLQNWDIKLTEITQGNERMFELFHDMMEQAFEQCEFRVDNTPLLIEAIPYSAEGIIIIVTKVSDTGEVDEKFSLPPVSKMLERFRTKTAEAAPQFAKKAQAGKGEPLSVFSFASLDDASAASLRIKDAYWGHSALYKSSGRYFLVMDHDQNSSSLQQGDLEAVLAEYGRREAATAYSSYYLAEHGETVIEHSAVNVLARF